MFDLNPRQAAFTGPPVQNTWHIGRRTRPPGFRKNAFSGVRFLLSSNISHLLMVLLSATPPHAQLSKI